MGSLGMQGSVPPRGRPGIGGSTYPGRLTDPGRPWTGCGRIALVLEGSETALVGRERERQAIAAALRALPGRPGLVVAIDGEPGIGKSRLLAHLAAGAAAAGATVLGTRASEFEGDLPYALWTEALDDDLARVGERRVERLGLADPAALATLLPALADGTRP